VNSRRRIPLAKELVKALRLHRLRTPGPLVFPGPSGGPIDYHNWRARTWEPLLAKTGPDEDNPQRVAIDGTFHMLRHFFVTALIQSGCNMKIAQTLAGHHSAAFTVDQYADAVPQQLEEAGEKVASVLLAASGSILVAAPKIAASVPSQVFDFLARPDGFEPPTTWFEVGHSESRIIQQNQLFIAIELCHTKPRYPPISR
jgi:Phage integrase family